MGRMSIPSRGNSKDSEMEISRVGLKTIMDVVWLGFSDPALFHHCHICNIFSYWFV